MRCDDCQALLIEYRYRELAGHQATEVAAHLAECGACAVAYCRLDADLSGIAETVTEAPPPRVHRALRARIAAEVAPSPWVRLLALVSYRVPAYQATLVAAALMLAWFAFASEPASTKPPRSARTVVDAYDASSILAIDDNVL